MARSRNIKPGFFKNEILAEIEPLGRILFSGLWILADREGRLEDRPKRIKAEILPYDNCDADNLLNQLAQSDFIIRYKVDGCCYIQIVNFLKHQNPHKNEVASVIPAPHGIIEKITEEIESDTDKIETTPADSLLLIPDSLLLIPEKNICVSDDQNQTEKTETAPAEKPQNGGAQRSAGKGEEYTPEFEAFWSAYPRRVGKTAAFKNWKTRLKDKVKPDLLIITAQNYAISCRENGTEEHYISHPKTFLGPSKPFEDYIKGPIINRRGPPEPPEPKGFKALREYIEEEGIH